MNRKMGDLFSDTFIMMVLIPDFFVAESRINPKNILFTFDEAFFSFAETRFHFASPLTELADGLNKVDEARFTFAEVVVILLTG